MTIIFSPPLFRRAAISVAFFALIFPGIVWGDTYTVTTTSDSGAGSLRQAISTANTNAGADIIVFQITGTKPFTISLASPLPVVSDPLTIDGETQPGYSNAPVVELNGVGAGSGAVGLQLDAGASGSSVLGLAINRFSAQGLVLNGTSNVIQGNFIGTDTSGTVARGNTGIGIWVKSPGNLIGGTNTGDGNLVSGGNDTGIYVQSGGNTIQGNWIGVNFKGTNALGNINNGIAINGGGGNVIGGTNAGAGNIVSGNGMSGVYLNGTGATGNLIQGNYLGTDVSGSLVVSNKGDGITLNNAPNNTLGPGNVISGNTNGISLIGSQATANVIIGNFIGTDATGKIALGNRLYGIYLTNSPANTIGGTTANTGNLISGNFLHGILFYGGSSSNVVAGNLIGLAVNGTNALPNQQAGILINGGVANTIGGTSQTARNIISGNGINGVYIGLPGDCFNLIAGNYIGTDISGRKPVANTRAGVWIQGCSNIIGGQNIGKVTSRNIISGNGQQGIVIGTNSSARGNQILGNFIGLDATGLTSLGNGNAGIGISGAAGNQIGSANASERNVISGNGDAGIFIIVTGATGNVIQGNYIGTDSTGTSALGNTKEGIYAESVGGNTIGGLSAGMGNVISGNNSSGISLTNATGFAIAGNYVGLNAAGTAAVRNSGEGVAISRAASTNWVGGSSVAARNVIAGNGTYGVHLINSTAQIVQGNYIGTDVSGNYAVANSSGGIGVDNSTNNLIGGVGAGNLVSGNGALNFPSIRLNTAFGNSIQGNWIGVNAAGTAALGNLDTGIYLLNATSNVIGGTVTGSGNVVSGNGANGLYFKSASLNTVQGNFIGLAADGFSPLGNAQHNVQFDVGSTNNILGGLLPGAGNSIAYAKTGSLGSYAGVRVRTGAYNNLISGNSIFGNDALGIDLGNQWTNPNIDCESGVAANAANLGQNYPILSNAVSGTATLVRGMFDSAAGKTYALQFFASPSGDPTGYGEGQLFLGQTNLTLQAGCATNFAVTLPTTAPAGWVITATATDTAGNTSEFSNWILASSVPGLQLVQNPGAAQFMIVWTNSGGSFGLLQSTNLNPPVLWTAGPASILSNGNYSVLINPTNLAVFYRLLAQ